MICPLLCYDLRVCFNIFSKDTSSAVWYFNLNPFLKLTGHQNEFSKDNVYLICFISAALISWLFDRKNVVS